ncbi:MBL fold metallo-hydrolase [Actinomycetospora termitidis]|uniref:MBL fold metallo-hydrolase n=1 Tax=Actinomycetospora termitidis TaxID=3053470 RepID=UPI003CE54B87
MARLARKPPANDEFEITLLGPGYGESIVIHLGADEWLVNDSCLDRESGVPAPLSYLESINVDPKMVRLVIASHWHDDHIRGLARVVKECVQAKFVCSAALRSNEFLALASTDGHNKMRPTSGISELRSIVDVTSSRQPPLRTPVFAVADTVLHRTVLGDGRAVAVAALSPSPEQVANGLQQIARLIPEVTARRGRVPDLLPNATSVAVWVDVGDDAALLGADLETSGSAASGWLPVGDSNVISGMRASAYKVAHHGSVTGHSDVIYDRLLTPSPLCVLTPFRRGRVTLPADQDIARLCERSTSVYSTVKHVPKRQALDSAVERTLREMRARLQAIDPTMGAVRLRKKFGAADWSVELSSNAGSMCGEL